MNLLYFALVFYVPASCLLQRTLLMLHTFFLFYTLLSILCKYYLQFVQFFVLCLYVFARGLHCFLMNYLKFCL